MILSSSFHLNDKQDFVIAVRYIAVTGEWSLIVDNDVKDRKVFPKALHRPHAQRFYLGE